MLECRNCRQALDPADRFCRNCGSAVAEIPLIGISGRPLPPPDQAATYWRNFFRPFFIIAFIFFGAFFIVALIMVGIWFFMFRR